MKLLLTALLCLVALAIFIAVMATIEALILPPLAGVTGIDWLVDIPLAALSFGLLFVLPARMTALPIPYQIRASTVIDTPPDRVWDLIAPRNRDSYWSAAITGTRIAPDDPTHISYLFEGTDQIGAPKALEAEIMGVEPNRYFAYRPKNGDQFPLISGDVTLSEFELEDQGGQTCVTMVEHLDCLRLVAIPMLLMLNPCRDALVRLKATAEGQDDTSWMGKEADRLRDTSLRS